MSTHDEIAREIALKHSRVVSWLTCAREIEDALATAHAAGIQAAHDAIRDAEVEDFRKGDALNILIRLKDPEGWKRMLEGGSR